MTMKQRYFKHILPAVLLTAAGLGMGSCVNDLDIQPIDPQQPAYNIDQNFAFAYSLRVSVGNLGLSSDEDKAGFYRTVFSLQEYPADGVIWQWQENAGIPALTNLSWDNGTNIPEWAWLRLGYDVTQYNLLLGNLAGKDDAESVRRRAEVRFLRALHYWYNLDLWGVAPVKEVFDNNNPVPKAGQELFDYIVAELKAVEPDLYAPGQAPFGRADRSACWLLLARLYLNAEVYTGTAHWAEAREYANKVLTDGYHHLTNNYKALFMADNDVNMAVRPEIVFPIRQDGTRMKEASSAAKFLVCASRDGAKPVMPDLSSNTWNCLLLKSSTLLKFFPTLDDVPYLKPDDFKSDYENFSRQEVIAFDREQTACREVEQPPQRRQARQRPLGPRYRRTSLPHGRGTAHRGGDLLPRGQQGRSRQSHRRPAADAQPPGPRDVRQARRRLPARRVVPRVLLGRPTPQRPAPLWQVHLVRLPLGVERRREGRPRRGRQVQHLPHPRPGLQGQPQLPGLRRSMVQISGRAHNAPSAEY